MRAGLELYRIFCTVAESGSVSAAARRLFISQPAVSQSILKLEQALSCGLFRRSRRGMTLTGEGRLLYEHASRALALLEAGEKKIASLLSLDEGEIRAGASDMTLQFFLLPYLETFHGLYPGVKISVSNDPTPRTLQALYAGEIDFCAVSEPFTPEPGYSSVPVRPIEDIFIGGEKFRGLAQRRPSLSELSDNPLIFLERESSTRRYIDAFFSQNSLTPAPEFELATSRLIVEFSLRNLGIGCVVRDFAEAELKSGGIYEIVPETPIPPRHICIVFDPASVSAAPKKLLDLILDNI